MFEQTILNCISDGVLTIDLQGNVQYVNRAMQELLGYAENEIVGKQCEQFIRSHICASEDCILRRTLKKKERISNFETYIINRDNRRVPVNINTDLLYDESGQLIGIAEVFRDISQIKALTEQLTDKYQYDNIITRDHRMKEILEILPSVAQSKSTVLILGESGTGKELIARAIHTNSPRKDKPFIAVNCAAIPESLIESELFGHVRGAFTGAYQERVGRFEMANHGTIFLDEIADMSMSTQGKLLRIIQEERFERLGDSRTIIVDVHIIAATNRNLQKEVKDGGFREDLYYRLSVFPITLPPLRERKEDIPLLITHFIEKFNQEMEKSINNISPQAMKILMNYFYPGNIRELKNFIEHAFICTRGNTILPEHLPEGLVADNKYSDIAQAGSSLVHVEKEWILSVLEKTGWKYQEAARQLGISRTTLWRKIKNYDLNPDNHTVRS